MQKILSALRKLTLRAIQTVVKIWKRYRLLPRWAQALILAALIGLLFLISSLFGGAKTEDQDSAARTVILRSLAELSGNATGESVVGSVRARAEAELRAEAAGTVRAVTTVIGATVPAGYVIAELDNDTERAQVTQAEGAYDAALASRQSVSPTDVTTAARNAYHDAFNTLDATLEGDVDTVFGETTPVGPNLLMNPIGTDVNKLSRERKRIDDLVNSERARLGIASLEDPETLLVRIESLARQIVPFVDLLVETANATNSRATAEQVAAVTTARTNVNSTLSTITLARATLRSGASGSTASVDAGVKSALGTLRLAQASLEKTRVRAPIAGQINYLPIRVGDYVGNLDHVATVAQNGALEIVSFISEESRTNITVGSEVKVEDTYTGKITSISPALDPVTKQIEIHIAIDTGSPLTNGQSVRLTLPGGARTPAEIVSGPVLLPLSAVKLSAGNRVVFTVVDHHLVSIPVTIGEVRGERIEVLTSIPSDTRVVTDARGLAEGQEVLDLGGGIECHKGLPGREVGRGRGQDAPEKSAPERLRASMRQMA